MQSPLIKAMYDHAWGIAPQLILTLLLIAFVLYRQRRGLASSNMPQLALSCLVCIIIIGLGFLSQQIIEEIFKLGNQNTCTIYCLELLNGTQLFYTLLFFMNGIFPGILLGILLCETPAGRKPLQAMLIGFAVLFVTDIIWLITNFFIHRDYFDAFIRQFPVSIICDMLGGPLAGIFCRWAVKSIGNRTTTANSRHDILKVFYAIGLSTLGLILLIIIIYVVVFRPQPDDFILNINQYETLQFKRTAEKKVRIPAGSAFEKLDKDFHFSDSSSFSFSLNGMLTWKNSIDGKDYVLNGRADNGPVYAELYGMLGCSNNQDISSEVQRAGHGIPVNIQNTTIMLNGNKQTLEVFSNPNEKIEGTIFVKNGALVSTGACTKEKRRIFSLKENLTLNIPLSKGELLVLGAEPKLFNPEKGCDLPTKISEIDKISLSLSDKDRREVYYLSRAHLDTKTCKIVPFENISEPPHEMDLKDVFSLYTASQRNFFVLKITKAAKNSWLSLNSENSNIQIDSDTLLLSEPNKEQSLELLQVIASGGDLTIGTHRISLSQNDYVLLTGHIEAKQTEDGRLIARGRTNYILLNNVLMNISAWKSLDVGMQVFILTLLAGGIAWLSRIYGRKLLDELFS
jgi:hypothetical protein